MGVRDARADDHHAAQSNEWRLPYGCAVRARSRDVHLAGDPGRRRFKRGRKPATDVYGRRLTLRPAQLARAAGPPAGDDAALHAQLAPDSDSPDHESFTGPPASRCPPRVCAGGDLSCQV
jgi:hypothetical protein